MKYLLLFTAALLASSAASATNYSGTWSLDKARSTNLPPFYSQVKAHTLTNTQTDKQLTVDIEIDGPGPAPLKVEFVYNLDGTPSTAVTEIRTPQGAQQVPTTMTTTVANDGKLHIDIVRDIKMGGQTVKGESSEDWSLSPDGQTLTVHLVRQNQGSDLVFVRQ